MKENLSIFFLLCSGRGLLNSRSTKMPSSLHYIHYTVNAIYVARRKSIRLYLAHWLLCRKIFNVSRKRRQKDGAKIEEKKNLSPKSIICAKINFLDCVVLWSVTSRRKNISARWCRNRHIHVRQYFLLFLWRRHRCRLYTCKICTAQFFKSSSVCLFFWECDCVCRCSEANGNGNGTYSSMPRTTLFFARLLNEKKRMAEKLKRKKMSVWCGSQWICMLMRPVFCVCVCALVSHKFLAKWNVPAWEHHQWQLCVLHRFSLKLFDTRQVEGSVQERRAGYTLFFWSSIC